MSANGLFAPSDCATGHGQNETSKSSIELDNANPPLAMGLSNDPVTAPPTTAAISLATDPASVSVNVSESKKTRRTSSWVDFSGTNSMGRRPGLAMHLGCFENEMGDHWSANENIFLSFDRGLNNSDPNKDLYSRGRTITRIQSSFSLESDAKLKMSSSSRSSSVESLNLPLTPPGSLEIDQFKIWDDKPVDRLFQEKLRLDLNMSDHEEVQSFMPWAMKTSVKFLMLMCKLQPGRMIELIAEIGAVGKNSKKNNLVFPLKVQTKFMAVRTISQKPGHEIESQQMFIGEFNTKDAVPIDGSKKQFSQTIDDDIPEKGYEVPVMGKIQVVIKNLSKTAAKVFLVPYNLNKLPFGSKKTMTQGTLESTDFGPWLLYAIKFDMCRNSTGKAYLCGEFNVCVSNEPSASSNKILLQDQVPLSAWVNCDPE